MATSARRNGGLRCALPTLPPRNDRLGQECAKGLRPFEINIPLSQPPQAERERGQG